MFTPSAAGPPIAGGIVVQNPGPAALPFVPEDVAPFVPTDPAGGPSYIMAAREGAGTKAGPEWWAGALLVAAGGAWLLHRRLQ
ncbi:MAG TPA: hypothetical protein VJR05_12275 [Acidimicrobiia bacterium]|nr:hypothetical protein [Acidimicrobiia bacterium]